MIPAASEPIREFIESWLQRHPDLNAKVFSSNAKTVMAAADVVVLASGTATLEVMLINRPMVVCYRFSTTTYRMFKWLKLIKIPYISLPNILADEELVPELLQNDISADRIASEVESWLQNPAQCSDLKKRFVDIHDQLRTDAAATAAIAVLNHIALDQGMMDG